MKLKYIFLTLVSLSAVSLNSWAYDDITGTWRSIDDKTGFSKGIVTITKDSNGVYTGKIIDVLARPGYTAKSICDTCVGELKNKPIIGLPVLENMKKSTKSDFEYEGGTILDPISGKAYKSKIKVNTTGTRMNMRGYMGTEIIGRSQTWIRTE